MIKLLLTLLLLTSSAFAQPWQGYDVLGLPKYCDTFLAAPKLPAFSVLVQQFGNPFPCIEKRIALGGIKKIQIDIIDGTCHRNNVCPPGYPKEDSLVFIAKWSAIIREFAVKYPSIVWEVSPSLENDIKSTTTLKAMMAAIRNNCPECKLINSPFKGVKLAGYNHEVHGTKVSGYSVSGDGASMFDADNMVNDGNDFEHRKAGRNTTYAWWNELNLRCTGEHSFTPIKLRTNRPELWQFELAARLFKQSTPKPGASSKIGCKSVRDVAKPEITKPTAEAYCNPKSTDTRGNKPLLIVKKKGSFRGQKAYVYNAVGKNVGHFGYYGDYSDPGLYRWYIGSGSKETPVELMDQLGSEWGFVKFPDNHCIRFNAIRRQGVYR